MSENVCLRVIFVVLMAPTLQAGVIDDAFGIVSDTICAAMSTNEINNCGNHFANEVQSVDNQAFNELKTRKICCAFNHLRDCINDAIGDKCGDKRETVVQKFVSASIGALKISTTQDCQTYNGSTGTFLCLNVIFIGFVVLFIFVCSATIKMCCGSGRQYGNRGSAQFVLLPQHNGDKSRY